MKIVALAGGVGGSKLCAGLAGILEPEDLTIIVNVGDDFTYHGLRVCPDLDTVCYTIAGMNNPETGWGLKGETWNLSRGLKALGEETWFQIGDRDAATHIERTRLLNDGIGLTEVTRKYCRKWGISDNIFPITEDTVSTYVHTADGQRLAFQEYFVKFQCKPIVDRFEFEHLNTAKPTEKVITRLEEADWIIICPSNPWVSIDPIIKIKGIQDIIQRKKTLAVSPIINGKALKGPAAKIFMELGIQPGALAVAEHYKDFLTAFVLDESDHREEREIDQWGIITLLTDIRMPTRIERLRLANEILAFCETH